MNFLAHSLLARGDPAAIAGQFCGDFVRGRAALDSFPEAVRHGIVVHRRIDSFTDAHAELVAARHLFSAPHRRLAGILIDILFDHFLARDWAQYSDRAFDAHVASVHTALNAHAAVLPVTLQRFSTYLQRESVLASYRSLDGVHTSYQRLARRSPAFAPLAQGLGPVLQHEARLYRHFRRFYPALDAYVQELDAGRAG